METKIATTVAQYNDLNKILARDTADMCYPRYNQNNLVGKKPIFVDDCPSWSLSSLLEQLPYEVVDEEGNSYNLQMNKDDDLYQIIYHDSWGYLVDIETEPCEYFIDACVEMIIKLKEKNLL